MVKRRGALDRPDLGLVQVLVDACLREHVVSARGLVGSGPRRDIGHPSIIRIGTAVRDIET
jgi:hypothetical protein